MVEAPTEEVTVPGWHKKTRAEERLRCGNQSLEIVVCLADCMVEKADASRVTGNPAQALDNVGRTLPDCI